MFFFAILLHLSILIKVKKSPFNPCIIAESASTVKDCANGLKNFGAGTTPFYEIIPTPKSYFTKSF